MSYLPALKGKSVSKFSNPLSGFVYDNKKYAESCIIEAMPSRTSAKCRSVPHSFFKQPAPSASSQDLAERQFRLTSKVFNLTKRLSDHNRLRCTRSKWLPQDADHPQLAKRTAPVDQTLPTRRREPEGKAFRFPEIRALILSVFHSAADHDKVVKLSLKSYFEMFFRDSLAGVLFPELIAAVEPHLRAIAAQEQAHPEDGSEPLRSRAELESESASILSKQELYARLRELEGQGKGAEAERLVRTYCLPARQVRAVFMQDLLKLVAVQLYENFNCNRHSQYVLLREDGQPISDFAAIGFRTDFLFVADRDAAQEQYERYIEITHHHSRLKNRFQFREQLKLNFRQKVARGHFFDTNAEESSPHERRNNVQRAQMIVDSKNEKNGSRGKLREMRATGEGFTETKSKSKSKSRERQAEGEGKPASSPYSIDHKIEQEFKILKLKNDFSNTILKNDESAKDKIELGVLARESVYFKEKSPAQGERILRGLGFIERGEEFEEYQQRLITLQDYARMRKVINCVGEREHTIRFVDRYLGYDEFGELRREDFRQVLGFIVGGGKTTDVILNTIWGWLEHNGVTSPSGIRRLDMQLLYERNKLVYYFLISLIFGTNEVSVLELTQDMLAD